MGRDAELIDYGATKGRWAANKKHEVESPIAGARAVVLKDLYIRGGLMGELPSYAHMLSTDSYRPEAVLDEGQKSVMSYLPRNAAL
ncbi:hypothetical protein CXG45_12825 [Pseudomonas plecoglossicida]|nr:hypothetical protein CXG45_12825 [Pseudomonas plecoglossicida]PLV02502.1 hypothetical protein CXG48_16220 [Pseudomonas plecoglossicida]